MYTIDGKLQLSAALMTLNIKFFCKSIACTHTECAVKEQCVGIVYNESHVIVHDYIACKIINLT